MKICLECSRLYPDSDELCPNCGSVRYEVMNFPFYEDIEQYTEENSGTGS